MRLIAGDLNKDQAVSEPVRIQMTCCELCYEGTVRGFDLRCVMWSCDHGITQPHWLLYVLHCCLCCYKTSSSLIMMKVPPFERDFKYLSNGVLHTAIHLELGY